MPRYAKLTILIEPYDGSQPQQITIEKALDIEMKIEEEADEPDFNSGFALYMTRRVVSGTLIVNALPQEDTGEVFHVERATVVDL